jgi:hypothetical protein
VLAPKTVTEIRAESEEILTNTIVIHFAPNSWDLHRKITREIDGKEVEQLYDPAVDMVLEEAAKLAGQFGAARIIIEGHTDASMKGAVPESLITSWTPTSSRSTASAGIGRRIRTTH